MPVSNQLGAFTFASAGSEFLVQALTAANKSRMDCQVVATIQPGSTDPWVVSLTPSSGPLSFNASSTDAPLAAFSFLRLTATAAPKLLRASALDGVEGLLSAASQKASEAPFAAMLPNSDRVLAFEDDRVSFDLSDAYGIYYREIFFFIPWLIASRLRRNGLFAERGGTWSTSSGRPMPQRALAAGDPCGSTASLSSQRSRASPPRTRPH